MGTLPASSPAVLTDAPPVVVGNPPATSDVLSPLISIASPATTPCFGVSLSTAAAKNPARSAVAGMTTHPLYCLSSPLAKDTLTAYSAIPEKASLFRDAKRTNSCVADLLRLSQHVQEVGHAWRRWQRGHTLVHRNSSSVCEPARQAVPSAVQTREASHTARAPRLPWVTHGTSSNLVVEERKVVVAQSAGGSGGLLPSALPAGLTWSACCFPRLPRPPSGRLRSRARRRGHR